MTASRSCSATLKSAAAVEHAVAGSNAVVSALGHAKAGARRRPRPRDRERDRGHARGRIDRLVVQSSPTVEDTADRPGLFYRFARLVMRIAIASVVRDHREQAHLIEESGLAWTIVRGPAVFTDGPHTGAYHAGPITPHTSLRISRGDLADFMLATSTKGDFVRMRPLVSK